MTRFMDRWQTPITWAFIVLTALGFMLDLWIAVAKWNDWWSWFLAVLVGVCLFFQIHLYRKSRALRMAHAVDNFNEPLPPHNVRMELPDGTVVPVELVYNGLVENLHQWIAVAPVWGLDVGGVLRADMIPGNTSIVFQNLRE